MSSAQRQRSTLPVTQAKSSPFRYCSPSDKWEQITRTVETAFRLKGKLLLHRPGPQRQQTYVLLPLHVEEQIEQESKWHEFRDALSEGELAHAEQLNKKLSILHDENAPEEERIKIALELNPKP